MDRVYVRPHILCLQGVFRANVLQAEDTLEERLREAARDTNGDTLGATQHAPAEDAYDKHALAENAYDKIPSTFRSLAAWPRRTNLRCWDSGLTHDEVPKFCPTSMRRTDDGGREYTVRGSFMSFPNVARFVHSTVTDRDTRDRMLMLLCAVYEEFTGHTTTHIAPAPPRFEMEQYCGAGGLSTEAYCRRVRELDPANALRDHTPGSVRTERDRMALLMPPNRTIADAAPADAALSVAAMCAELADGPVSNKVVHTVPDEFYEYWGALSD